MHICIFAYMQICIYENMQQYGNENGFYYGVRKMQCPTDVPVGAWRKPDRDRTEISDSVAIRLPSKYKTCLLAYFIQNK